MDTCWTWKKPSDHSRSLILAGDTLFAGGDDTVAAYHTSDGKLLWKTALSGIAAAPPTAAGTRILVTTTDGTLQAFRR